MRSRATVQSPAGYDRRNLIRRPDDLVRAGGVGDGATNCDAALASLSTSVYLPEGDFLVTAFPSVTDGRRFAGPGRLVTATSHRRTWEFGGESATYANVEYFVDAAAGDDVNDGLTSGTAFKTLQRAWNQIPALILHRVVINVADGTYNEQEMAAADMPRASILWCTGKFTRGRSDQEAGGAGADGFVVFVGESKAGVIIETAGDYKYGAYISQCPNVALSNLTLRSGVAGTVGLLVAHRSGTYVQGGNIDIDGNGLQASIGAYAEAGAVLELTGDGVIQDCQTNVLCFDQSLVQLANEVRVEGGTTDLSINGRGTIELANECSVAGDVYIQNGQLKLAGTGASDRVTLEGELTLINSELNATYADFLGPINPSNSRLYMNTCGYAGAMVLDASDAVLSGTPSYVAPASASTVATPVTALNGSRFVRNSAAGSPIVGSGGRTNVMTNAVAIAIAGNGATVPFFLGGGSDVLHVIHGDGADRTACVLAAVDSSYGGDPPEYQVVEYINTTANTVQIVNGSTAVLVGGAVTLGAETGAYQGIRLRWQAGAWREVARSLVWS